jgi:hypothetical protein
LRGEGWGEGVEERFFTLPLSLPSREGNQEYCSAAERLLIMEQYMKEKGVP